MAQTNNPEEIDFASRLRERRGGQDDKQKQPETIDFASRLRQRRGVDEGTRDDEKNLLTFDQLEQLPSAELSLLTRFNIAAADNNEERQRALQKEYPEGQYIRILDNPNAPLAFRPKPGEDPVRIEDDFATITKQGPDSRRPYDVELDFMEPVTDIAEFFGEDTLAAIFEVGALALTRKRGPGSREGAKQAAKGVKQITDWAVRTGVPQVYFGSTLGHLTQEGIEELQGINVEDYEQIQERALISAAWASSFEYGGHLLGRLMNVNRSGLVGVDEEGSKVLKAFNRLGIDYLPSQITNNPVIQRLESLASQVLPSLKAFRRGQSLKAVQETRSLVDRRALPGFADELLENHDKMRREIINTIRSGDTTLHQAGTEIGDALNAYSVLSGVQVSNAYNVARRYATRHGGVEFDISPVKRKADDILESGTMRTESGELIRIDALEPELRKELETLATLSNRVVDLDKSEAMEQIKLLRGRFHDLTLVEGGRMTSTNRAAREVYQSLNEVFDNPISGDKTAIRIYKKASRLARQRFDTLEKSAISGWLGRDDYSTLALNLLQPGQQTNIMYLKNAVRQTGKTEAWDVLQNEFTDQLVRGANNGDDILKNMNRLDSGTLNEIASPEMQQSIRGAARQYNRLAQAGIEEAVTRQNRARRVVRDIIAGDSDVGIQVMQDMVRMNPNSKRTVRAAVMDEFVNTVVRRSKSLDGVTIDDTVLDRTLKEWNELGVLRFMTTGDKRFMADLKTIAPVLEASVDAGSAMAGAQTISGLRGFSPEAFKNLLESYTIGRLFTGDVSRRVLFGSGKPMRGMRGWQALGAVYGELANDFEREEQKPIDVPVTDENTQ